LEPFGYIVERLFFDFSLPGSQAKRKVAEHRFNRRKELICSRLAKYRFKNLLSGLRALWKPDCDCFRESLRAVMGTLGR
jgi:hypothetical protein